MNRRWLVLLVAPLLGHAPRADACTCGPLTDAQALSASRTAFDGVAVADEPVPIPKPCALPPPRAATAGCLALTVWDRRTCAALAGADVQLWAADGTATAVRTDAAGQADACGLSGAYQVRVAVQGAPPDTAVDVPAVGAAAVIPLDTSTAWRTRFEVRGAVKGDLPRQVWVGYSVIGEACGIGRFELGRSYRIYGSALQGDTLSTGACSGVRPTADEKLALDELAAPAPEPAPATATVRPRSGCAGCASGGGAAPLAAVSLALLVALRSRRGR